MPYYGRPYPFGDNVDDTGNSAPNKQEVASGFTALDMIADLPQYAKLEVQARPVDREGSPYVVRTPAGSVHKAVLQQIREDEDFHPFQKKFLPNVDVRMNWDGYGGMLSEGDELELWHEDNPSKVLTLRVNDGDISYLQQKYVTAHTNDSIMTLGRL